MVCLAIEIIAEEKFIPWISNPEVMIGIDIAKGGNIAMN
jgi:hypothetical protein